MLIIMLIMMIMLMITMLMIVMMMMTMLMLELSRCQDFNLDTPLDSPPSERTLNPPSLSLADWEGRLRVEDWRNTQRVGSIYPLGEETAPVWSRKYYKNISGY